MIEINMVSGAKFYAKMEKNTERANVGVLEEMIAGSRGASIPVFEDAELTVKVYISSLKIEYFKIIV